VCLDAVEMLKFSHQKSRSIGREILKKESQSLKMIVFVTCLVRKNVTKAFARKSGMLTGISTLKVKNT